MRCQGCGHDNPADARFCLGCGTRLTVGCAACRAELPAGARFCHRCGTRVEDPAGPPAPRAYTPPHLAERILTSRSALQGERKRVTVLFADLKGSMELLAETDPEHARHLLDPVLEHMMEAVHRYEGTVNQVMGDGIMALFGAPLAHEDHAVRACYAALRMQEAVARYAEGVRRAEGAPIQIRVGLNSGEVVVRSIGSDLRMDYTAVGQTTHLAARMEQMASPGSTLLTAHTLALAEGFVQARGRGPVPVRGLAAAIDVFELTGVSPVRSRLQAAAARGLTRFTGRDAEMAGLTVCLEAARGGRGQVVALIGEAGVGKSRLSWEFSHSRRTAGFTVLEAPSVSYGRATPCLPVVELLRAYFHVDARDDRQATRDKVVDRVLALDAELRPALPALLALLDVGVDDAGWRQLEPEQRRRRTLDGVKALLLRESRVTPVLLVFEDLHWIDSETQALLDELVDSLPAACVLLLVSYRPEYAHGWGGKTYYRQLRIDPLAPAGAADLLRTLLGSDPSLAPLGPLLIERTEGNPFFLEESVRALVETGALSGVRGAYRLVGPPAALHLPPTVQPVLAARIDRLPSEAKAVLQVASVIGKDVPHALLAAVADLPEDALRAALGRLRATEFLYEARLFPDVEYTFKHALTQEVAYDGLLREERRAFHARIVAAIEAADADRLAERADVLGHHAFLGQVWDRAVRYLRQAGARAMGRSALQVARARWEQALDALGHLPETRERAELEVDVRLDLRLPLWSLGELDRAFERMQEARPIGEALGDPRRLARVLCFIGNYHWIEGAHDLARPPTEAARAMVEQLGDTALGVMVDFYLALIHASQGDLGRAAELLRRNVGRGRDEPVDAIAFAAVLTPSVLGNTLADLGEFDPALRVGQQALDAAEARGRPFEVAYALGGLGTTLTARAEFARAIPPLARGFALAETGRMGLLLRGTAVRLGYAYVVSGRVDEGLRILPRAADPASGRLGPHLLALWGEACLAAGDRDQALAIGRRALNLARARREPGAEAEASRLLGDLEADRASGREAAAEHYEAGLGQAQALRMRPLAARCQLGLGQLHARGGQRDQARARLAAAAAMLADMGMAHWLAEARAELDRLG